MVMPLLLALWACRHASPVPAPVPPTEPVAVPSEDPALPVEDLRAGILRVRPLLARCAEQALLEDPDAALAFSPGVTIGPDGSVSDVEIGCDTCPPAYAACLEEALRGMRFPPLRDGASVELRWPLNVDGIE
jgi:hypothetical protein